MNNDKIKIFERTCKVLRQFATAKREDPTLMTYSQRFVMEKRARLRC